MPIIGNSNDKLKLFAQYRPTILMVLFIATMGFSYGNEPDSILQFKAQLKNNTGEERLKLLKSLARFYADTCSQTAINYATEMLDLSKIYHSREKEARAHRIFSSIYKFQIEYDKSLMHNQKALEIYEELHDSTQIAHQYYRISENYIFLNQYDSARHYNDLSYQYFKNNNNIFRIFNLKIQFGKVLCVHDKNEEAREALIEAVDIARKLDNKRLLGWAGYWLGFVNMKLGNFAQAKSSFMESIEQYSLSSDVAGKIGSEQELGELYLKIGEFAKAYRMYYQANLKQAFVKGDKGGKNYNSQYFINISNIYFSIGNYDRALSFLDSAAQIATKNTFTGKMALISKLKGSIWFWKGNSEKALTLYKEASAYYESRNIAYALADLYDKKGEVYEKMNKIPKAISTLNKALDINTEIDNKFGIVLNHYHLASCYYQTKDYSSLKKALDGGMEYALVLGNDLLLLRYYELYIKYCDETGHHNAAHNYFDKYLPLSTAYLNKTKRNYAGLLFDLHENEMNERNKTFSQELELSNLTVERDSLRIKILALAIILILLILAVIAYFLVNRIRMTRALERQVEDRTKALKENEKKLININQTKDKFYSIIAHDLKSPFNSLIGFSNLLNDEYDDFSTVERKQFIAIIRNSSEEIFALLENLLDWSRKNSDKIKFKPIKVDLQQIVRQAFQLLEKNALQKNISIKNLIPKNTFVFADENMLRTIIRNLASNALKFSNEEGVIKFECSHKDSAVYCSVSDNGIGMSEKIKTNLFNIDSKVKKKGTANEKGTGLGLLLCKDFVERNGGTISVESTEGQGTTFTFSLPSK